MLINERDLSFLYDIYESAVEIEQKVKSIKYHTYKNDKDLRQTIERKFEIIGVATNKLSKETLDKLSSIPWGKMVGLRNIIAHEYRDIIIDKVWYIAITSVPELVVELEKIEELKEYISK